MQLRPQWRWHEQVRGKPDWNDLDHLFDLAGEYGRRVDPLYWCHKFYQNHANWCIPPSAETLRRLIWMAIAGGASAFTFWQYRSERVGSETNGFGLREVNGAPYRPEIIDAMKDEIRVYGRAFYSDKDDI